MIRVLKFPIKDEINERRYVLLQQGFLIGGLQVKDAKTTDVYRREVAILDLIEALGTVDTNTPIHGVEEGRQLTGAGELRLTQAQYDLLKRYVLAMPWGPSAARSVVDLHDWLESAEKDETS